MTDGVVVWRVCAAYFADNWAHLEHLATADDPYGATEAPFGRRLLAETGIFLDLAADIEEMQREYGDLIDRFERLVERGDRCSQPAGRAAVLPNAEIAYALRATGSGPRRMAEAARSLEPSRLAGEVRPVIEMATRYIRAKISGSDARFADLLPHSVVGRRGELCDLTRADLYDLTHWIFYLSDFGRQTARANLDGVTFEWLGRTLPAAIERADGDDDSDLLAELLACCWAVGLWRPDFEATWEGLRTEALEGRFRRPGFSAALRDQLGGAAGDRYAFRHTYHTYVALAVATRARDLTAFAGPS